MEDLYVTNNSPVHVEILRFNFARCTVLPLLELITTSGLLPLQNDEVNALTLTDKLEEYEYVDN